MHRQKVLARSLQVHQVARHVNTPGGRVLEGFSEEVGEKNLPPGLRRKGNKQLSSSLPPNYLAADDGGWPQVSGIPTLHFLLDHHYVPNLSTEHRGGQSQSVESGSDPTLYKDDSHGATLGLSCQQELALL